MTSSSTALLDHIRRTIGQPTTPSNIYPAEGKDDSNVVHIDIPTSNKSIDSVWLSTDSACSSNGNLPTGQSSSSSQQYTPRLVNRPNYHIGLNKEELKGSPKQRLEALLSSTSSSPTSPLDPHPQTAILGTLCGADSINLPRKIKEVSNTGSEYNSTHSSSRSSPTLPATGMANVQRQPAQIPREPSLGSAMSSKSSAVSGPTGLHTTSASVDLAAPDYNDTSTIHTISASADTIIQRLTKEKQALTTRNEQLWKLVEKQRTMILGLNKDLDMLAKDRERYRKKLKDQQEAYSQSLPKPSSHAQGLSIDSTASSKLGPSDLSLRNPIPRTTLEMAEPPYDDEVEQAQRRPAPTPLPLRIDKAPHGIHSPDPIFTPKSNPVSPDITSPGGSKKKAPPTPLNLGHGPTPTPSKSEDQSLDQELEETDSDFERGRRKTREDDDRASEENRSRSKKEKSSKSKSKGPADDTALATVPIDALSGLSNVVTLPSSPRAPLLGVLQSPLQHGNVGSLEAMMGSRNDPQNVSTPNLGSLSTLKSPGLPMSPRPGNRTATGPAPRSLPQQFISAPLMSPGPMSARGGMLSPRPPRQPIPLPHASQFGTTNPHLARAEMYATQNPSIAERVESKLSLSSQSNVSDDNSDVGPIYRGFMTKENSNQLLPPTTLHLIDVETYSPRLRPSSQTVTSNKMSEDDLVVTLAIHARSDGVQLWRVEKTLSALQALDQSLKRSAGFPAQMPDKNLFSGHAPVKVDQRRAALDEYFAILLGSQLDDSAVRFVSSFLSTDAIGPKIERASPSSGSHLNARKKDGYLAKKGKSFGGWKARYSTLDGKDLLYFDAPGGEKLGSIRLHKAQIAYQNAEASSEDSEYRHAFMILEQKRDESSHLVRHVLCAESDQERDSWMSALRLHIEAIDGQTSPAVSASPKHSATLTRTPRPALQPRLDLQAVGYEQTVSAGAPTMGSPTPSSSSESPVDSHAGIGIPSIQTNFERLAISGPVAGGPIQNASAWGNKPVPAKESKRNIFGFKSRSSEDNTNGTRTGNSTLIAQHHSGRAVFGMCLAEAVELFPPVGIDICLPAPVYRCVEWFEAHNAVQEQGLFRQSGSQTGILSLKDKFNHQGDVNLLEDQGYDCHTIASLLKMYLRELPESILTRPMYLDFLKVLEVRNMAEKLVGLNVLVHRLPEPNFELLSTVFRYLVEVVANQDRNLMGVKNLATIWTAALSIPAPLIDHFITNHDSIFGDVADEAISPIIQSIDSGSPTASSGGGMDELRSPRKQMFTDLATPMPNQTTFGPEVHGSQQQAYEYATMNAQSAFRGVAPPVQHYHTTADHGFGSLNAALAPTMMVDPPSPRSDEPSKLVKKGRRESSIRALGISAPIGIGLGPTSPGLMSPGLNVGMAVERRKSSMNRFREIAGFKEEG